MAYALLREDSPNTTSFATKAAALAAVRSVIAARGAVAVLGIALGHSPLNGGLRILAEDADLVALALRQVPSARRSARPRAA